MKRVSWATAVGVLVLSLAITGCKPKVTPVPAPNVANLTQTAASAAIIAAGLTVGAITEQYNATVPAGQVISQTPAAGEDLAPGTVVTLVVSLGPEPVSVPNLVGLTQTAAQSAITAAGFAVGAITGQYSATVPAGQVISQTPAVGEDLPPGTVVTLVVSLGPEPPNVPSVTLLQINSGAASATDRKVTLNNTCTGDPTDYMASESATFSGAAWQSYAAAPSFQLSSGNGAKTVYFKAKNASGESAPASATIMLDEDTIITETFMLPGDVPLVMIWIEGGTFLMGCYPNEPGHDSYENPQHTVTLGGFWIAKYELTKRQWTAVMETAPWSAPEIAEFVLADPESAAVNVSWNDAQAFIAALNGLTGQTFRLPGEAQWEFACRAGTTTRFYWGDDPDYTLLNDYAWNAGNTYPGERYAHLVGQKTPNAFGLYDMSGNAAEWCEDDWHDNYTGAPADDSAWVDSPRSQYRVQRGGDWNNNINCRSAARDEDIPSGTQIFVGFRLAR